MKDKTVSFKKDGSIGIITLNRAGEKNPITAQTAAELKAIRAEIGFGSEINVVVLTGKGKEFFSCGTDPREYPNFTSREEFISKLSTASMIGSFDRPTIAAINGDAIGQGLELALACDIRIASETARFAIPQVTEGEMAFDGGTQRLPRLVGRAKALEMILLGQTIDSQEALEIGLVNQVAPPDELMPAALKMARDLAAKGPLALRYVKEAIHKGMDMTLEQGLRLEADLYFLLHTTEDRTAGVTAFRDKKKPDFKGK
ncbi:MAG: enoyl-CoA hydratase/isomerase family protein [Deltaproteobacteria bacterium]|nr:enoyl-CoA hydratase/isomerase family protein [Deltaproteobacteria bacterium]